MTWTFEESSYVMFVLQVVLADLRPNPRPARALPNEKELFLIREGCKKTVKRLLDVW